MNIKLQTDDKKVNQGKEVPVSYEAFFKNPSGKSENNNILEDDLLQQNKSATIIEDHLTYDDVEEEDVSNKQSPKNDQVRNPFIQDNDMFNDDYQASVTVKGRQV